ncbi:hypothetical protein PIB30_064569, partial [Stylosanthes scabra]|nr:hypothetical protein [Stylosanthes scabra]
MFAHNRVNTLRELKQLILSHLGPEGGRKSGNLAYRFQALTADNQLEYRPSWISKDSHVWMMFEVHKKVRENKVTTPEMIRTMRMSPRIIARRKMRMCRTPPRLEGPDSSYWHRCRSLISQSTSKSLIISGPSKPASLTCNMIVGRGGTMTLPRHSSRRWAP